MDEQTPTSNQPEQPKIAPTKETLDPNKKYRRCSGCGQYKEIKSPWKELWRWPTMQEWIVLFMIVMMLFVSWAYKRDVQMCRDFIANGTAMYVGNFGGNGSTQYEPISNIKFIFNDTVANVTASASIGGGEGNVSNITQ